MEGRSGGGDTGAACGMHCLGWATVSLQRSGPFERNSSLNTTCFSPNSLPNCPLCFRVVTTYTSQRPGHKGSTCAPTAKALRLIVLSRCLRTWGWDRQELGCWQDTQEFTGYTPSLIYSYRSVRNSPCQLGPCNTLSCSQRQGLQMQLQVQGLAATMSYLKRLKQYSAQRSFISFID